MIYPLIEGLLSRMKKRIKDNRGITLIEIIVSIAILGIIVAPLSNLFSFTIQNNARTRRLIVANQIAQERMEMAKNAIATGNITYDNTTYDIASDIYDATYSNHNMSVDVEITRMPGFTGIEGENGGSNPIPSVYDISFDMGSHGSDSYVIEISASGYSIKKKSSMTEVSGDALVLGGDISMKLDCSTLATGSTSTLDVINNSDDTLLVYKVLDNNDAEVKLVPLVGRTQVITGLNTVATDAKLNGRVYYIEVATSFNGNNLVELDSYVAGKSLD